MMIPLQTKVNGFTVSAVKAGNPRDYLLIDKQNTVMWLDELALKQMIRETNPTKNDSKETSGDTLPPANPTRTFKKGT